MAGQTMTDISDTKLVYLILANDISSKSIKHYVSFKLEETDRWLEIKGYQLTSDQVKTIKNKKIQDVPIKQLVQDIDESSTRIPWHNIIRMDRLGTKKTILSDE
jgi:hypothetical protein